MKDTKLTELPTIKDMALKQIKELEERGIAIACPCYPPKEQYEVTVFSYDEIIKWLLVHEQRAIKEYEHAKDDWEDTFDRWDKFREEELEPLLEDAGLLDKFADLYDELVTDAFGMNCLKGELNKLQALKGEVKK